MAPRFLFEWRERFLGEAAPVIGLENATRQALKMVDKRFFGCVAPVALAPLLEAVGAGGLDISSEDASLSIEDIDTLETAGPSVIALAATKSYVDTLKATRAGVVIVAKGLVDVVPAGSVAVLSDEPQQLFVRLLEYMFPLSRRRLASRPLVPELGEPELEENVYVAPSATIGSGARVGSGSVIGPNAVIGPAVAIGRNSHIGANVVIECSLIGDEVVIHPGAVIGVSGFGWLEHGKTNTGIPQLGRAILQSGVEVGANSGIDRGALGDTVIGEGTKIGGLVEIGHNCRVGRYCLLAPTSGLAGSTIVGDGVLMGPGSGTAGHLSIGSNSVIHGRSVATKDWPAGSRIAGTPAQDIKSFWREAATIRRLVKGDDQ